MRSVQIYRFAGCVLLASGCTRAPDANLTASAELALKQAASPGPRISSIDWAAAEEVPVASDLPASAAAVLADVPLPVLVPATVELQSVSRATVGRHWYGVSMVTEGHNVYVNGNRAAFVHPTLAAVAPNESLRITRSHGIVTAAFVRFGAGYTVNIECEAPLDDARCTDDAYVREMVRTLLRAGGRP